QTGDEDCKGDDENINAEFFKDVYHAAPLALGFARALGLRSGAALRCSALDHGYVIIFFPCLCLLKHNQSHARESDRPADEDEEQRARNTECNWTGAPHHRDVALRVVMHSVV